ncbi:MAG: polysaccharide deacetylase family protein [Flavisolibacter sp.]|jgi:peptidoglycan/xylan/chitin deacetylase (PgdA/CDA1 family)
MHKYFIKTPWLAKQLFSSYVWNINTTEKDIYLTFDDGPHPTITPWVLEQLRQYEAKASFFCIGNNVHEHPKIYQQILKEGHAVGNHTFHHLNGWKTDEKKYLEDIAQAAALIETSLFRPPYGRIKSKQAKQISTALNRSDAKVIMWDVLSADFDLSITKEECLQNVLDNFSEGSIVVFHDSEKAFPHLQFVLPKVLAHLQQEGYICRKIEYKVKA